MCSSRCCCSSTPAEVTGSPGRSRSRPGLHGGHGVRSRSHVPLGTGAGRPRQLAGISWTGAVVLMFAAIVPSTPIKTMLAGLLAVSMNPIAMWIARARGAVELRCLERRLADALSGLPSSRRRGRDLTRGHRIGSAGCESARDGELPARRAPGSWRDGGGLPRHPPHAGAAGGDQADSARGDWCRRSCGAQLAVSGFAARRKPPPACGRRTPWNFTTSASPTTRRSTSSWSCWRA